MILRSEEKVIFSFEKMGSMLVATINVSVGRDEEGSCVFGLLVMVDEPRVLCTFVEGGLLERDVKGTVEEGDVEEGEVVEGRIVEGEVEEGELVEGRNVEGTLVEGDVVEGINEEGIKVEG